MMEHNTEQFGKLEEQTRDLQATFEEVADLTAQISACMSEAADGFESMSGASTGLQRTRSGHASPGAGSVIADD